MRPSQVATHRLVLAVVAAFIILVMVSGCLMLWQGINRLADGDIISRLMSIGLLLAGNCMLIFACFASIGIPISLHRNRMS